MAGLLAVALMAVALVGAPGALAAKRKPKRADVEAPVITHAPLAQHDGRGPLIIEATIVDDSGVFDPALLVRAPGGTFERIAMLPIAGRPDSYTAEVPAALLADDIEYLIEAFDDLGNGPARAGEEAAPLRVARLLTLPVAALPTPPPPQTEPADDDGGDALLWGAGIAVGSVILLGAAAGIGFAVLALSPPENVTVTVTGGSPIAAGIAP